MGRWRDWHNSATTLPQKFSLLLRPKDGMKGNCVWEYENGVQRIVEERIEEYAAREMDYEEGLILETGTHTPLRSKGKKIRKTKSKFSLYLRIFFKKKSPITPQI